MLLRDMQIPKSEKKFLPPPLPNPGDAPEGCQHSEKREQKGPCTWAPAEIFVVGGASPKKASTVEKKVAKRPPYGENGPHVKKKVSKGPKYIKKIGDFPGGGDRLLAKKNSRGGDPLLSPYYYSYIYSHQSSRYFTIMSKNSNYYPLNNIIV